MFEYFDTMYGNDLSHSIRGNGSGSERAGHKYQSRYWKNGKWNYIYKDGNGNLQTGNGKLSDRLLAKRRANIHNSEGGQMAKNAYEIHTANQEFLKNNPAYASATSTLGQEKLNQLGNYTKNNIGRDMTWDEYNKAATSQRGESYVDAFRRMADATHAQDWTGGNLTRNAKAGALRANDATRSAANEQKVKQKAASQRNSVRSNKVRYAAESQRNRVAEARSDERTKNAIKRYNTNN